MNKAKKYIITPLLILSAIMLISAADKILSYTLLAALSNDLINTL